MALIYLPRCMVWMIYDWPFDNRGRMWPHFLTFIPTVEENPRKNLNQVTDPTADRTRVGYVRSNDVTHSRNM